MSTLKRPFDEAEAYRRVGWSGTIALPARSKAPPPEGYTGADGRWPTPAGPYFESTPPKRVNPSADTKPAGSAALGPSGITTVIQF